MKTLALSLAVAIGASTLAHAGDSGLTYRIVGTGQNGFYGNTGGISRPGKGGRYYGQDAQYEKTGPHYVDNGDGTVTDTITGLIWEKGFHRTSWSGAADIAATARTGGRNDWRVPTIKELYSLMLFTGNQGSGPPESPYPPGDAVPFLEMSAFDFEYPNENRYIDAQYLTKTRYVSQVMGEADCFFGVNFADGRIKCYPVSPREGPNYPRYYVRLVRGNSAYGKNKFVDNGDDTVTDRATGLMWAKVDSGNAVFRKAIAASANRDGSLNWQEALAFAENLNFAGHDDWRLPDAKELHSIVDYSRSPDTTGSAAIDPVFQVTPIRNEAGVADFPGYWSSTSFRPGRDAVSIFFGRALGYFSPVPWQRRQFLDVHGAGAQRTDPKYGQAGYGHGPQGDTRRPYNYVRVVRTVSTK